MTARVDNKFLSYLDDIAAKVEEVCQNPCVRAAMATKLCIRFWPELSRVQAELVVDAWTRSYNAATAAEEYEEQSIPA